MTNNVALIGFINSTPKYTDNTYKYAYFNLVSVKAGNKSKNEPNKYTKILCKVEGKSAYAVVSRGNIGTIVCIVGVLCGEYNANGIYMNYIEVQSFEILSRRDIDTSLSLTEFNKIYGEEEMKARKKNIERQIREEMKAKEVSDD